MNTLTKFLLFLVLPLAAPLLFPPENLRTTQAIMGYAMVIGVAIAGIFMLRGSSTALTLAIFLQGFNVITRLMMFLPQATTKGGDVNLSYLLLSLLSIGLSFYLMFRLDRSDVRVQMVT